MIGKITMVKSGFCLFVEQTHYIIDLESEITMVINIIYEVRRECFRKEPL